jgi:hypothetical protein
MGEAEGGRRRNKFEKHVNYVKFVKYLKYLRYVKQGHICEIYRTACNRSHRRRERQKAVVGWLQTRRRVSAVTAQTRSWRRGRLLFAFLDARGGRTIVSHTEPIIRTLILSAPEIPRRHNRGLHQRSSRFGGRCPGNERRESLS